MEWLVFLQPVVLQWLVVVVHAAVHFDKKENEQKN